MKYHATSMLFCHFLSQTTYNVSPHLDGGQPANLVPFATVAPSRQQPYLVSAQVKNWGQPSSKGPVAALKPSLQQPNVVLEQGSTGSGLHRFSPNRACNSSLVSSVKGKITRSSVCYQANNRHQFLSTKTLFSQNFFFPLARKTKWLDSFESFERWE